MKLQIDTTEKVIKVEEQVNFGELVKTLNKLLPKGEWKTYKLETNTVINWNQYPIITYPTYPICPTHPSPPYWYVGDTVTALNTGNKTLTGIASGTYNIDTNLEC